MRGGALLLRLCNWGVSVNYWKFTTPTLRAEHSLSRFPFSCWILLESPLLPEVNPTMLGGLPRSF